MDNLLQIQILQDDTRGLFVPTSLQRMVIDVRKHISILHTLDPEKPGIYHKNHYSKRQEKDMRTCNMYNDCLNEDTNFIITHMAFKSSC